MSIVFTVQSEERVLCTSKPLIWEAVQWGWGGVGERGQEIRIGVINNFCSVINQRHGIPLPRRYTCPPHSFPLLLFSFILNAHFHLEFHFFFPPPCRWSYITFSDIDMGVLSCVICILLKVLFSLFLSTTPTCGGLSSLKLTLYCMTEWGYTIICNDNH